MPFERVLSVERLRVVAGACLIQVGILVLGFPWGAWGWLLPAAALVAVLIQQRRARARGRG